MKMKKIKVNKNNIYQRTLLIGLIGKEINKDYEPTMSIYSR